MFPRLLSLTLFLSVLTGTSSVYALKALSPSEDSGLEEKIGRALRPVTESSGLEEAQRVGNPGKFLNQYGPSLRAQNLLDRALRFQSAREVWVAPASSGGHADAQIRAYVKASENDSVAWETKVFGRLQRQESEQEPYFFTWPYPENGRQLYSPCIVVLQKGVELPSNIEAPILTFSSLEDLDRLTPGLAYWVAVTDGLKQATVIGVLPFLDEQGQARIAIFV